MYRPTCAAAQQPGTLCPGSGPSLEHAHGPTRSTTLSTPQQARSTERGFSPSRPQLVLSRSYPALIYIHRPAITIPAAWRTEMPPGASIHRRAYPTTGARCPAPEVQSAAAHTHMLVAPNRHDPAVVRPYGQAAGFLLVYPTLSMGSKWLTRRDGTGMGSSLGGSVSCCSLFGGFSPFFWASLFIAQSAESKNLWSCNHDGTQHQVVCLVVCAGFELPPR